MKINRKVLSMALGGAALPWGLATADDSLPVPPSLSSVGRIGDAYDQINNTSVPLQRPVMRVEPRSEGRNFVGEHSPNFRAASHANHVPARNASYASQHSMPDETMMMEQAPMVGSGCSEGGSCASSCDGIGYRPASSRFCGLNNLFGCGGICNRLGWGEIDAILWWGPNAKTPPLVATGEQGQFVSSVVLGGPDAPLGGELLPGLRANLGFWMDSCKTVGVGGRAFGLFSPDSTETFTSDGSTTLGIPFLNALQGDQDAYLVAFDSLGNGVDTGSITVDTDTDLFAAEAYGRFLLAESGKSRADLIGGYTFARLDDTVGIYTRSVQGIGGTGVPINTVEETWDRFSTKNTFHGGHLGFTTDISCGRWTFSTLGKVAIGNMNQQYRIRGSALDTTPNGTATRDTGVLALDSNIGTAQRDVFTFLPEAGAKLRYCLTPRVRFNIGYTFLFFPDVAMAGTLIDPILDLGRPQTIPVPQPRFEHECYYLHGLDLGFSFCY